MEQEKGKKKKTVKYVLIGLGAVAVAGTAAYFIVNRNSSTQSSLFPDEIATTIEPSITTASPHVRSGSSSSGFPLKKGSRGELVRNIQEALISKFGSGILPKFGADGHWGSEMQSALISKGFTTTIGADDFKKIITSSGTSSSSENKSPSGKNKFNPSLLAKNIRLAILDDDLDQALNSLSKIWTVKGYTKVNTEFKKKRIDGVRKTLVNALLTKFFNQTEKKALNASFYRIGLKYNGRQWSLNGLVNENQLQTIESTRVWNEEGKKITVPANTILGEFIDARNEITQFRTLDNQLLFIQTKSISYV